MNNKTKTAVTYGISILALSVSIAVSAVSTGKVRGEEILDELKSGSVTLQYIKEDRFLARDRYFLKIIGEDNNMIGSYDLKHEINDLSKILE